LEIFRQKGFDNLEVHSNAVEFLVRNGFHRTLGARPMKQVVAKFLGDAVAASVLANAQPSGTFDVMSDHSTLVLV
jgi:ATP-dependent Clp protease ATP-binding subunit ClpB